MSKPSNVTTSVAGRAAGRMNRRKLLAGAAAALGAAGLAGVAPTASTAEPAEPAMEKRGSQRLSLEQLQKWEGLRYGMFITFGMNTFEPQKHYSDGQSPAATYAPDKLDVDQWVSVARDSGMKYAMLVAKHVAGHCLWPSKHTDYTVANSGEKTDVVGKFVESCRKRGVLPGLYYCSWDDHNRFGSRTISDWNNTPPKGRGSYRGMSSFPRRQMHRDLLSAYTTSLYQTFQTAQVTELLTEYGPVAETWIDVPQVLGRGYREFLYRRIAQLQPETVIMMNCGISDGTTYPVEAAWPSDLIAVERTLPPASGHRKWRTIEGKDYYLPAEMCDTLGKQWFFEEGDAPRSDETLLNVLEGCRRRGANLLLNAPPDKHGLISDDAVAALGRLAKNANL
jgi:alpha-L-fucosidase